jgi:hypothetical protein
VNIADGQRVSLNIDPRPTHADDLSDVADLLDADFGESCRRRTGHAPSLAEVRRILSGFNGSLADRISEERDER